MTDAPKNRDRLEELEAAVAREGVRSPSLVTALRALAGHEIDWANDRLAQKEQTERESDHLRGIVTANKKLIRRLTTETGKR